MISRLELECNWGTTINSTPEPKMKNPASQGRRERETVPYGQARKKTNLLGSQDYNPHT